MCIHIKTNGGKPGHVGLALVLIYSQQGGSCAAPDLGCMANCTFNVRTLPEYFSKLCCEIELAAPIQQPWIEVCLPVVPKLSAALGAALRTAL